MTTSREKVSEEHVGFKAIKKRGFFSGLVGIIKKSNSLDFDYVLEFGSGSRVVIIFIDDVELLIEE